jgi:hypothetical protein
MPNCKNNRSSKPFIWIKPSAGILAKLKRLPAPSEWISALGAALTFSRILSESASHLEKF